MKYINGLEKKGPNKRARWALMSSFDIPCRDGLYLRRLRIVQTPWFGVYIHEMKGSDASRDLHDHPWNFWSLILKGGYTEFWNPSPGRPLLEQRRTWNRWTIHRVRAREAHTITHLQEIPTYTLVIVGKRQRIWGFYTNSIRGWVPWDQYHIATGGEQQV